MRTTALRVGVLVGLYLGSAAGFDLPQAAAQAPGVAAAPSTAPTTTPGRGARGGRGGRGTPASPEEIAEMAKLAELPAYKSGLGDGDYSIGPDYAPAPEITPKDGVPKGKIVEFTMNAADSKFYPNTGLRGEAATRKVIVYIPAQYVAGTASPFIVSCDAYGSRNNQLPNILDNMIAEKRLPSMIAIMVNNGGGDGPGSERGLEYDTVSGKYAEFVEAEILPRVEKEFGVTLTKDPKARMTLGGSSGGSAAMNMAWFHPEWYQLTVIYSGTFVNQVSDAQSPHGAWEYHENMVPKNPAKPIRIWMHVSQNDNQAGSAASGLHNWVIANQRMAAALKAKGYHYQFVYAKAAGHTDGKVISQTLPQALEYVWKGYPIAPAK